MSGDFYAHATWATYNKHDIRVQQAITNILLAFWHWCAIWICVLLTYLLTHSLTKRSKICKNQNKRQIEQKQAADRSLRNPQKHLWIKSRWKQKSPATEPPVLTATAEAIEFDRRHRFTIETESTGVRRGSGRCHAMEYRCLYGNVLRWTLNHGLE